MSISVADFVEQNKVDKKPEFVQAILSILAHKDIENVGTLVLLWVQCLGS